MINPKIRLAENSESDIVRGILEEAHLIPDGLEWSRVFPSWLVAEYKGEIVAVCQILQGYPIGAILFLAVTKKYQNLGFGVILLRKAEKVLASMGCDAYCGLSDHAQIMSKLEKWGAIIFGPKVNWIFKRVYRPEVNYESVSANNGQH